MFDHIEAHRTKIEPWMEKFGSSIKELIERVKTEAALLKQNFSTINLDLPWPERSNLRHDFEALSDIELCDLARISYYYGHWNNKPIENGWTWKVSNYCDQVLRNRLGLCEVSVEIPRIFYEVHEGMFRVCIYGKDFWTWDEVGPATRKNLELLKEKFIDHEIKASKEVNNLIKNINKIVAQLRENLDQTEISKMFLDIEEQIQKSKSAN